MDIVERRNTEKGRSLSDSQAGMLSVAEGEAVISIRDFNLWYGDFQALKNIYLEIPNNRESLSVPVPQGVDNDKEFVFDLVKSMPSGVAVYDRYKKRWQK